MAWTLEPVESYTAGEVENYAVTFYLGVAFDNPLPSAFLSDVMATERTVCWFSYNLWQIAWNDAGYWDPAFSGRYGFQFAGVDSSGFPEVQYKEESLVKDLADPDVGATMILDPNLAEVKAIAYRPATDAQPGASWPYVVHSGNLWYFADSPFSYVSEEDRYLVFCDLIHDIVGIDHAPSHRALIRIEDVDPIAHSSDLKSVADYLASQRAPFEVATIPVFNDPLGVVNGTPQTVRLSQSHTVVNALKYMVSRGGQIIDHGYTHQYDSTPNPYDGMTGDDCEFLRSVWNEAAGDTELIGPLPEDSVAWVNGRIDQALAELAACGFAPIAWETPHYLASSLDSVELGHRFNLIAGRVLYFTSDGADYAGQFYPYVIERDVYNQRILPENLGNVEPVPFYDCPARFPEDIVRAAQKSLVVRDGWASAYFHPDYDIDYLKQVVSGVKALGYTYTAASTVMAEAGPDETIIAGESTTLEGSASNGVTPYHYSWSPTAGLSNPAVAHPAASPDSTTLYTLTVTDSSGGTDRDTVGVLVIPRLFAEAGPGRIITPGDSTVLGGSASGGQPPYSYSWSPSTGIDAPHVVQPVASPSATTTYTLTVTDSGTQAASDTVTVTVVPHTLSVTASVSPGSVASAGSAVLSASASDSGPHEIASWSWSDGGAGGSFSPSPSLQNPTYSAPANTTDSEESITLTVTATCDGPEPLSASNSTLLVVQPAAHSLVVSASAVPAAVASGGTATLSATAADTRSGHTIASWSWSDGGAGGSFSLSPSLQNPTYTAPANTADSEESITLTVTATCDGPEPLSASNSTLLVVQPVAHSLVVSASAVPAAVASGGTATLSATAADTRSGHTIASWSWSDGGAGGSFSPSPSLQNPTYSAPANTTDSEESITLTVTATCDGPEPLSASNSTLLVVQPAAHSLVVSASAVPAAVASGGTATLSATAADTRSGHTIASWSWSDGGAGGSFSPSAAVSDPQYRAPENLTGSDITICLTVTGTCDGPEPLSASNSTLLVVQPVAHSLVVSASAVPAAVASGGTATLSATAADTRSGHTIASWSWSDGGAGGSFSLSPSLQNPTYTAPANTADSEESITLTVTATCDGPEPLSASNSTLLVVQPVAHSLVVSASAVPAAVASGGTATLSATAADTRSGHTIASWSWSDGGAGGSFSLSPSLQNPTYTAPANTADSEESITLTVTATCDGPEPLSASNSTLLVVQPVAHSLVVSASAVPAAVASGGTATLSATAADTRSGHTIASWSWSDGGAGGSFSLSPSLQNPTYTAPANTTDSEESITLTVTATCDGPNPASDSGAVTLAVQSVPPGSSEVTARSLPLSLSWGEAANTSITYQNLDAFTWRPGEGYHLEARGSMDRWGVASVPLEAEVLPGATCTFDFSTVAPPLTTLSYDLPVTTTSPGVPDGLGCGWQLSRGEVPWKGGLVSEDVVISRFSDIQPGLGHDASWARFHIEELAGRVPGVVRGYDDGTYRPAILVARDAMAVYILRALKLPTAPYQGRFRDVTQADSWAWAEIEGLARAGVVQGFNDGTYRPAMIVNRDAMAAYISRALVGGTKVPDGPPEPSFKDVLTDHWAYNEIECCVAHGIVQGFDTRTYRPGDPVSRGQMAVYMWRAFVMPTGNPVVLGGPAVTAVNPGTATYNGWSSRSGGPASEPGYAYVVFDAARLGPNLAAGDGSFDVRFDLRGPVARAGVASLTEHDLNAARDTAWSSGVPYYAVWWDIPGELPAGLYTLVVSVEHEPGVFQELDLQPEFTITP